MAGRVSRNTLQWIVVFACAAVTSITIVGAQTAEAACIRYQALHSGRRCLHRARCLVPPKHSEYDRAHAAGTGLLIWRL